MNAIYILLLRELKRYSRSRAMIVASLGQPLLYLLVLGFGLGPVFQKAGNGSYLQFVAPGVIGMSVLFTSVFSGIGLLWDRQFGFLKQTLVAPVPRITVMIGKTLGGATVATIQGLLVLVICLIAGFRPVNWLTLPLALVFMIMTAIVFAGLGMAIAIGVSRVYLRVHYLSDVGGGWAVGLAAYSGCAIVAMLAVYLRDAFSDRERSPAAAGDVASRRAGG